MLHRALFLQDECKELRLRLQEEIKINSHLRKKIFKQASKIEELNERVNELELRLKFR